MWQDLNNISSTSLGQRVVIAWKAFSLTSQRIPCSELRTTYLLGKHCTTELYPLSSLYFNKNICFHNILFIYNILWSYASPHSCGTPTSQLDATLPTCSHSQFLICSFSVVSHGCCVVIAMATVYPEDGTPPHFSSSFGSHFLSVLFPGALGVSGGGGVIDIRFVDGHWAVAHS